MNERKELGKILFLTRESRIDIFNSSSHRVIFLLLYTAVSRKVVLQKRKSERDNVESYYG